MSRKVESETSERAGGNAECQGLADTQERARKTLGDARAAVAD